MARPHHAPKEEIIRLGKIGLNNKQISEMVGCTNYTITCVLRKAGLKKEATARKKIEILSEISARCTKCNLEKSLKDWPWGRSTRNKYPYRLSYCKDCKQKQARESVNDNPIRHLKLLYNLCRQKCPQRGLEFSIQFSEIKHLYQVQKNKCFYTDSQMTMKRGRGSNPTALSFDRMDTSKGYIHGNVVLCCRRINTIKSNMTLDEMKIWTPDWHMRCCEMYKSLGLQVLWVMR